MRIQTGMVLAVAERSVPAIWTTCNVSCTSLCSGAKSRRTAHYFDIGESCFELLDCNEHFGFFLKLLESGQVCGFAGFLAVGVEDGQQGLVRACRMQRVAKGKFVFEALFIFLSSKT